MIIEFRGFLDKQTQKDIFKKLPSRCCAVLNYMCKYNLPFNEVLNYFYFEDVEDLILKESNYRLNTYEFVVQAWSCMKKHVAELEYDYNCIKEEDLNYILRLGYDSHYIRKELSTVVKQLELVQADTATEKPDTAAEKPEAPAPVEGGDDSSTTGDDGSDGDEKPAPETMKHDEKIKEYKHLYQKFKKIVHRLGGFDNFKDAEEIQIPHNLEEAINKVKEDIKMLNEDEAKMLQMATEFQNLFLLPEKRKENFT